MLNSFCAKAFTFSSYLLPGCGALPRDVDAGLSGRETTVARTRSGRQEELRSMMQCSWARASDNDDHEQSQLAETPEDGVSAARAETDANRVPRPSLLHAELGVRSPRLQGWKRVGWVIAVGVGCNLLCVAAGFADTFSPESFGIGATLVQADSISPVVIRNCSKGGPADRAGLLPGDTLAELDGQSVLSWPLKQVIDYLIRDKPLPLRVTVYRGGASLSVELVRARIADIAAGVGLRYEPTADSTHYRTVPLNERPAVAIGAVVSPTGLHDRECHDARFMPSRSEHILIYFWASWCGPCKILMKEMAKDPVDPSRVRIIGVNVDAECETFRAAADSLRPSGEQFWAGGWYGDFAQAFRVHRRGIPTAALLDREARLVGVSTGVDSVMSMLRASSK